MRTLRRSIFSYYVLLAMPRRAALIHRAHSRRLVRQGMPTVGRLHFGEDRLQGVGSHQMTMDEARRIAANFAKLPGLLRTPMT